MTVHIPLSLMGFNLTILTTLSLFSHSRWFCLCLKMLKREGVCMFVCMHVHTQEAGSPSQSKNPTPVYSSDAFESNTNVSKQKTYRGERRDCGDIF